MSAGDAPLPGGRILERGGWLVEHCTGPLGVGALVVKPERHCEALSSLTSREAASLGPLLRRVSAVVEELTGCDQVYCCLWSHAGWQPVHIHFVLQPAWNAGRNRHAGPGPAMQAEMFERNELPDPAAVAVFCDRARALLAGGDATGPAWVEGGCHCGAVRFRVQVERLDSVRCNCSLCAKRADRQLIVPPPRFELLAGSDRLTSYRFHTGTAEHRFCAVCGIHVFNHPRSHPDSVAVNVRCLDGGWPERFSDEPFDGQNWEASIAALRAREIG